VFVPYDYLKFVQIVPEPRQNVPLYCARTSPKYPRRSAQSIKMSVFEATMTGWLTLEDTFFFFE
jgi:hypothetical protein